MVREFLEDLIGLIMMTWVWLLAIVVGALPIIIAIWLLVRLIGDSCQ